MHWGYGIFGCSPCFTHFYLFAHIFYPFLPHLLFFSVDLYGDTLLGCLLVDIILPSSFLRPTFSMDLRGNVSAPGARRASFVTRALPVDCCR